MLQVYSNDPLHITHDTDTSDICCQSPSIFQMTTLDRKTDLLHLYHAHASMLTFTDAFTDTVFSPDEQLRGSCNSFTVSKCRFKFGNLQMFCYYSNDKPLTCLWETIPRRNLQMFCYYSNDKPLTCLWETIPRRLENNFITSISALKLCITSTRQKCVSKLFECL